MSEQLELGTCCACRERPATGLVFLDFETPAPQLPGSGWSCLVCGLEPRGAVAVLCDECGADDSREILDVVVGYAYQDERRPVAELEKIPFLHDRSKHDVYERMMARAP